MSHSPSATAMSRAPAPQGAGAVYEVRDLVKRYRGADHAANAGLTFDVAAGEVFGVLGPNGAGKTTLVRQLVGLLQPDQGRIRLLGTDLDGDPRTAAARLAYLPQDQPALADLRVHTAIETTARLRGARRRVARAQTAEIIEELGLGQLARRPMGKLSGGQRRLAGVATALVGDRPLLVLDEPTTGLDTTARRAVWQALNRRRSSLGTTVVLVTHNVLEAETVLDRVLLLAEGRVVACDTPGALKRRVADTLRLELAWREGPIPEDPDLAALAGYGRRCTISISATEANRITALLTRPEILAALDGFTLSPPSLEDVLLGIDVIEGTER